MLGQNNMENYPKKSKTDKVVDTIHVGAQFLPLGIGGAISEFIKSFWPQGFEKRKEEWLQCLSEEFENMPTQIREDVINYLDTEEGKTLLLKAAIAAISTHKTEKYRAIRNVLLSSIADQETHYDQKEIYVGIITELEPYDLVLLKIINLYNDQFAGMDSYKEAFEFSADHGFQGNKDEFFLVINKLKDKSLVRISDRIDGFGDVYSADVIIGESTVDLPKIVVTEFAKKFISYVKEMA